MDEETLATRVERLDAYLADNDLDAVWFARPNAFAWLTGGNNVVDRAAPMGVAAAGYVASPGDAEGGREDRVDGELRVVTNNIEAGRLAAEELPAAFDVESAQWYEASLADAVAAHSPERAAADFDVPGFARLAGTDLRQPLTERDVERYRSLGYDAAAAVESVCRALEPTDTEREVAAAVRVALAGCGIEAPVALVGGGERAPRYRHFTPTDATLDSYAVVSVTAERDGLHASLTRTVSFDPPEWLGERHRAAIRVETAALGATRNAAREGGTAGDVFERIRAAYAAVGWDDEWRHHHQGGAAGFAGREWIATPEGDAAVRAPMAYAWNPTVRGAKSEDTVLVTTDGFEVLTTTGEWPTAEVSAAVGEASIDRHLPLDG